MTSTTPTRIIAIALAALAITAPVAGAMPTRDDVQSSSLGGTTSEPRQDLRNPDQQAPAPEPYQDLRNPDQVAPAPPAPAATPAPVVVGNDGTSPLVYILPSLVLVAMLAAATIYARSSRPTARV